MKDQPELLTNKAFAYTNSNESKSDLEQFQKLLNSSLDIICSIDEDGRFILVSAACKTIWGYSSEELRGSFYIDYVKSEDKEFTRKAAADIMSGIDMPHFENRYIRKDGRTIPMLWSARWSEKDKTMYCVAKDATETKKAELLLKESEKNAEVYAKRLNDIVEHLGDGFYSVDTNFTVTFWNKKAELFLKKKKIEVIGRNIWDLFPQAKNLKFFEQYHTALSQNIPVHFEEYVPHLKSWLDVSAYPSEYGLSIYFKNINEKKAKEEELKISNERYEIASKATSDALWDWDLITNTCFFNNAFTTLFGYKSLTAHLNKIWVDNIHEEDQEDVYSSIQGALKDLSISQWNAEYRFYREDRTVAFVLDRGYIIRNDDGTAVRMVGSMQDISILKAAEQKLERKERKFRAMVQSGQDMIALLNASIEVEYISSNYCLITGYTETEMKGLLSLDKVHPDDYQSILKNAGRIRNEKEVLIPIYRFKNKKGEYRWFETTLTNYLDNPDIEAIIANTRDVTEKKKTADELQRLSLVAKETKNAVVITDEAERIIWVNNAFMDISEYSLEEAIGRIPEELLQGPKTCLKTQSYLKKCIENKEPFNCEILSYSKSGMEFWVEIKGQPIFNEKGEVEHFFAILTDISERIELQQMVLDEKIAAQKDIAKAIIDTQEKERSEIGKELHDNVNQVLTTVKLYIENIQNYPDHRTEFIEKSIQLSQRAINEIRCLAKQLVTPVMYDLGFKATIDELVDHYTSLNAFNIQLSFAANEERLDKGMKLTIYRIIQEQLNNIVKYAKASVVKVEIAEEEIGLKVLVIDNGVGFDATKISDGLGLNNIKNRAEVYKGKVSLTSAIGIGCSLIIHFPVNKNEKALPC